MMKPKNQRVALATFLGRRLKNTPPQQQIIKLFAAFSILFFLPLISWADTDVVTITVNNTAVTTFSSNNLPITNITYTGNYSGVDISGQMEVNTTTSGNTTSYTYTINSVADMVALSYMVNKGWSFSSSYTFQLANDLDFSNGVLKEGDNGSINSGTTTGTVSNFTTIGNNWTYTFNANFDGNNKQINNLKIQATSTSSAIAYGLFGLAAGDIKNLAMDKAEIEISTISSSYLYVGSIVGMPTDHNGTQSISKCVVKNTNIDVNVNLSEENVYVGALIGAMSTFKIVTSCESSNNKIRCDKGYVGGFMGRATYSTGSTNFYTTVRDSVVYFWFGSDSTSKTNKVYKDTITTSGNLADEIGMALVYINGTIGFNGNIPVYVFENNSTEATNSIINRVKEFGSEATYLRTQKWNFVARLGETLAVLNNNKLQISGSNTAPSMEMAALDFVYGTQDSTSGANNWNTEYLYASDSMTAGAGYFVWPFNTVIGSTVTTNTNDTSYITKVTPSLLTATPTENQTYSATNYGTTATGGTNTGYWYALGNPFDKALAVSDIVNTANTNSTDKSCVWIGEDNSTSAVAQIPQGAKVYVYDSYSQAWDSEIDSIYPGQGFMVAASQTQKQVNFRMVYPTTTTEQTSSKSISQTNEGIRINCLANGTRSSAYVKQMANAQDGFDINDAYVLFNSNENRVEPYFVVDNNAIKYNRYASDNYVCDISFHAQRQATAKISVSDVPQEYVVSILDLAMGTETVLDENSFFEIDVEQGENAGRYKIKITKGALSVADVENVSDVNIWNNKGNIYVSGKDLKSVEVLNTLGQSMMMKQVGGNEYNFNFNDEGTYIIRVKSNSGTKTQKVVLTK